MATESVPTTPACTLSLRDADSADELILKAISIADVIGIASTSNEAPRDGSILGACWTLMSLLADLKAILDGGATVGVDAMRVQE